MMDKITINYKKTLWMISSLTVLSLSSSALAQISGKTETIEPAPAEVVFQSHGGLKKTGIFIDSKRDVYVWGNRDLAQQGNGSKFVKAYAAPMKVESLSNVMNISGDLYHLLAIDASGRIYGWGKSHYGELGCAGVKGYYAASPCLIMENGVQIAAGEFFSIALDTRGKVWAWGSNLYGQLGNGGKSNSKVPVQVNLKGETARLIGSAHEGGFAVTIEGHVWAWGDNEASGLGIQGSKYGVKNAVRTPVHVKNLDRFANDIVYIAGGNGWGQALLYNGAVIGWGLHAAIGQGTSKVSITSPEPVLVMQNVKQLYSRYNGSVALTTSGEIYTWGKTSGSPYKMIYGETPTLRASINNEPVIKIGGGREHIFYYTKSGIYGVGYNDHYKLNTKSLCGTVNWPGAKLPLTP